MEDKHPLEMSPDELADALEEHLVKVQCAPNRLQHHRDLFQCVINMLRNHGNCDVVIGMTSSALGFDPDGSRTLHEHAQAVMERLREIQ